MFPRFQFSAFFICLFFLLFYSIDVFLFLSFFFLFLFFTILQSSEQTLKTKKNSREVSSVKNDDFPL